MPQAATACDLDMTSGRAQIPAFLGAILSAGLLAGCSNTDFGRVNPDLVSDDMHAWVGATAALGNGVPASIYPLTDDERALRDLAYPLIEPPYDRQRWYSFLNEYGVAGIFRRDWSRFDQQAYARALLSVPVRSQEARYAHLIDDIQNDRTRIPQFFQVAARVLDMDRKREASLAAIVQKNEWEQRNALARNAENGLVMSWVQWSLAARSVGYRYALERLVLGGPTPSASAAELSLVALDETIAAYRLLPGPDIAPRPGIVVVPPFLGPTAPPPAKPLSVLGAAQPKPPPESTSPGFTSQKVATTAM